MLYDSLWYKLHLPCNLGEGGLDGDGDVTKPSNLSAFKEYVIEHTDKKGVHFVMADGVRYTCGSELLCCFKCYNCMSFWFYHC